MKASKLLKKQFADFKAELAALCLEAGGKENPDARLAGERSSFVVPCGDPRHGDARISVHAPWDYEGNVYPSRRLYSSSAIFISFWGDEVPKYTAESWGERPHHKWNIHASCNMPGRYVECCNNALTVLSRRLKTITARATIPEQLAA